MNSKQDIGLHTTPPLSQSQMRVLQVVIGNVVATNQCKSPAPISAITLADFKETFPSLTKHRALELLYSIMRTVWSSTSGSARVKPIFYGVKDKGHAFIVEIDKEFLEQGAATQLAIN